MVKAQRRNYIHGMRTRDVADILIFCRLLPLVLIVMAQAVVVHGQEVTGPKAPIHPVVQEKLCGVWGDNTPGGGATCAPPQDICWDGMGPPFTSAGETGQAIDFASDGTYIISYFTASSGSGCDPESGALSIKVDARGTYELLGENPQNSTWTMIKFTPVDFTVFLNKNNKEIRVERTIPTLCEKPVELFNDPVIGCPCGDVWELGINNTRTIVPSQCVDGYGNSTCHNDYWFDERPRYGNIRLFNATTTGVVDPEFPTGVREDLFVDLTFTNVTTQGYSVFDIEFVKTSLGGCRATAGQTDTPTPTPTPEPKTASAFRQSPAALMCFILAGLVSLSLAVR